MERDYLIAGLRVRMSTYGRTQAQAEPYLHENNGEVDIVIESHPEQLQQKQPHLDLDACEYLSTGGSFYRQLMSFDGLMLHASAVVKDGYAYLFSAPCGTGKSTHTKLWRTIFEDAVMLNDDKPALRKEDGVWYAYGTPWSGKTSQNQNIRARLGGVCVLRRGKTNEIERFEDMAALFALLDQTARPSSREGRGRLLELLDDLLQNVPVWKMKCTPENEAAMVSYKAMSTEAIKRFG